IKIAIGADHAGFSLKEQLRWKLAGEGYEVIDFGTGSSESCDYPDFAQSVGRDVAQGRSDRGILVCSTGIGMERSLLKIQQIVRQEMNSIGGQEMYLPALNPAE